MSYTVTQKAEQTRLHQAEAEARQSVILGWLETHRERRERQEREMRAARVSLFGPYEEQDNG